MTDTSFNSQPRYKRAGSPSAYCDIITQTLLISKRYTVHQVCKAIIKVYQQDSAQTQDLGTFAFRTLNLKRLGESFTIVLVTIIKLMKYFQLP